MTDGAGSVRRRCVHCHDEVEVSERYAHGDHLRCGHCGTDHKLVRGDRPRLVLGDVTPLRDALALNGQLVARLEAQLAHARASFGIGVNGIGIALAVAVYRVGMGGAPIDSSLLWSSVGIALFCGLLLEGLNWAFFAKRSAIQHLSRELTEAREE